MLISIRYLVQQDNTSSVHFQYSSCILVVLCKWDWRHGALGDEREVLVGWDVHSSSANKIINFSKTDENRLKMGLSMGNSNLSLTLSAFKDKTTKQLW